ncbi:hypothetical protein EDF75_1348 [Raoultella sp. BIGb0149]|uniref:hypothetical protein n=1 Tax=Raoultella sp. BIGb0149 TaxID=2485116 RepID=UPI00105E007C|nr:hypothetical protein [Raoultella sp. BIGb0149]TDQ27281.1 hypothetical protein EDF75_1348 [Raoultella sp. BIGb0149]
MSRKVYVSMADMARRYGYTFNAIKGWRAEGLPYSEIPNGIPEIEGTQWIIKNKIEPLRNTSVKEEMDLEKLREQKAKADLAMYAAQEKSGELISVDIVQAELNKFCASIKDTLRLIPAKHSIELIEHADSVDNLKFKLKEIINAELLSVADLFEPDIEAEQDETLIDID